MIDTVRELVRRSPAGRCCRRSASTTPSRSWSAARTRARGAADDRRRGARGAASGGRVSATSSWSGRMAIPGWRKAYGLRFRGAAAGDGPDAHLPRARGRTGRSDRRRRDRRTDRGARSRSSSTTTGTTFRPTTRCRSRAPTRCLRYPQVRRALERLAGRIIRRRHARDELRRRRAPRGSGGNRAAVSREALSDAGRQVVASCAGCAHSAISCSSTSGSGGLVRW